VRKFLPWSQRQFSQERRQVQARWGALALLNRLEVRPTALRKIGAVPLHSSSPASEGGQISDSFFAAISRSLPDQHRLHAFADFAVANRAIRRQVHSQRRSCFSRSARLAFSRLPFSASRISSAAGSVWRSAKLLLFLADRRLP